MNKENTVTGNMSAYNSPDSLTDKCIVWDLDMTLIKTFDPEDMVDQEYNLEHTNMPIDIRRRLYTIHHPLVDKQLNVVDRGSGRASDMIGVIRPHARETLKWCFEYFRMVVIWTAGTYTYGEDIVNVLFSDMTTPDALFGQDFCVKQKLKKYDRPVFTKPLSKLYKHEFLGQYMNETNTIIVDDKTYSFESCNPKNAIHIPEYYPEANAASMREDERALLQIQKWFMRPTVRNAPDVRTLKKDGIFS